MRWWSLMQGTNHNLCQYPLTPLLGILKLYTEFHEMMKPNARNKSQPVSISFNSSAWHSKARRGFFSRLSTIKLLVILIVSNKPTSLPHFLTDSTFLWRLFKHGNTKNFSLKMYIKSNCKFLNYNSKL